MSVYDRVFDYHNNRFQYGLQIPIEEIVISDTFSNQDAFNVEESWGLYPVDRGEGRGFQTAEL